MEGNQVRSFRMLPPAPGSCQDCAVPHAPGEPHNQKSLYYQMKFFQEHGRYPTWKDATAHCNEELQILWRQYVGEYGEAWDTLAPAPGESPAALPSAPGDEPGAPDRL